MLVCEGAINSSFWPPMVAINGAANHQWFSYMRRTFAEGFDIAINESFAREDISLQSSLVIDGTPQSSMACHSWRLNAVQILDVIFGPMS